MVGTIHRIDGVWLQRLLPLLRASFGEEVTLSDECDFFEAVRPTGWLVAAEGKQPSGFVRQFPVGPDDCLLELFVAPSSERLAIAERLLLAFDRQFLPSRPTKATLRLRLAKTELLDAARRAWRGFEERGFSSFEAAAGSSVVTSAREDVCQARLAQPSHAESVRRILSGLVDRDLEGLRQRIDEGRVVVLDLDGTPVGAAEVNVGEHKLHLVTLAVEAERRRRGHGRRLLQGLLRLFRETHPGLPWITEVATTTTPRKRS